MHLMSLGASNSEIKRINEAINELQRRAGIKIEDHSDKISLLRKIEVKFQKLVEQRMIFSFFDNTTLLQKEKEIKDIISQANYDIRKARAQEASDAAADKARQKIAKKNNLKVAKNIRMVERSKKDDLLVEKKEEVKTPPEVEEMRRYMGQMPEAWEQEMFRTKSQMS